MLLTRETNLETPQIYIKKWPHGPEGESSERLLTQFPHPHPSIKDLQKEVIRSAHCPHYQSSISYFYISQTHHKSYTFLNASVLPRCVYLSAHVDCIVTLNLCTDQLVAALMQASQ